MISLSKSADYYNVRNICMWQAWKSGKFNIIWTEKINSRWQYACKRSYLCVLCTISIIILTSFDLLMIRKLM